MPEAIAVILVQRIELSSPAKAGDPVAADVHEARYCASFVRRWILDAPLSRGMTS
jgi:hypothetical protein